MAQDVAVPDVLPAKVMQSVDSGNLVSQRIPPGKLTGAADLPPTEDYLITPNRFKELWEGPIRIFFLVDSATPTDPFLAGTPLALNLPGKRLLVNRP
jgi:hypothetical protein